MDGSNISAGIAPGLRLGDHMGFAPSRIGMVSRSLRDFTIFCVVALYFLK
jgi:hypothetical protein